MRIVDQVLMHEFRMTLSKNDREGPCMYDLVVPYERSKRS